MCEWRGVKSIGEYCQTSTAAGAGAAWGWTRIDIDPPPCTPLCGCWIGGLFSSLFSRLWGDKEVRILVLGLDNAGKTTILYRLQVLSPYKFILNSMVFFLILLPHFFPCVLVVDWGGCHDDSKSVFASIIDTFWNEDWLDPLLQLFLSLLLPFCGHWYLVAIGFNVETVTYKNIKFQGEQRFSFSFLFLKIFFGASIILTLIFLSPPCCWIVWDLGGQSSIRWVECFPWRGRKPHIHCSFAAHCDIQPILEVLLFKHGRHHLRCG